MKKGLVIALIILGVLVLIGLIYYFLIYKKENERSGGTNTNSNTVSGNNNTPPPNVGSYVYINTSWICNGCPNPNDDFVVYSYPIQPAGDGGKYIVGRFNRTSYIGKSIGKVIDIIPGGQWVKIRLSNNIKAGKYDIVKGFLSCPPESDCVNLSGDYFVLSESIQKTPY